MIVHTTCELPRLNELIQVLKDKFSNAYSFKIFGFGSQKTILVKKSIMVGAQITLHGNEILVDGSFPNIVTSSVMTLLSYSTIAPFEQWFEVEKEIGSFLRNQYN
ncbi:MAG: hypothetical protein ACJAZM_002786 [Cyclobacteriaceae bacterium]|jgi:hypothetical protein